MIYPFGSVFMAFHQDECLLDANRPSQDDVQSAKTPLLERFTGDLAAFAQLTGTEPRAVARSVLQIARSSAALIEANCVTCSIQDRQ
ncbi:MAG: hypothetical protein ABJH52_01125 [Henriciella sp.]